MFSISKKSLYMHTSPIIRTATASFLALAATQVTASDFTPFDVTCGIDKMVVIEEDPIWFFGGGAAVRSINASFTNSSPDFDRQTSHGDPGLYHRAGRVTYKDGYVDQHAVRGRRFGGAGGYVKSEEQIKDHPLGNNYGGIRNYVVEFSSDDFAYSDYSEIDANASDSDNGVGPYLQLGRRLTQFDGIQVNFTTGWSFISTENSTGARPVARITEDRTDYTYRYDYIANPDLPRLIPGHVNTNDQLFIIDPRTAYDGNVPDHSRPTQETTYTRSVFTAYSTSNLDVNLNEIPFGLEVGHKAGPVDLFLTGGFTLNIIDYELENRIDWIAAGSKSPVASQVARDSGTPLKVGLYGGLVARCNLSEDGRFFIESSGTYRWVDPVQANAGLTSVEIDPSSWEGRFGIGFRF